MRLEMHQLNRQIGFQSTREVQKFRLKGSSFGRPRLAARVYSQAQAGPDTLVLVESPAKAKKIQAYLGPAYQVLASYGHVRDLPPKAGSVEPAKDFSMQWQVMPNAHSRLASVASSLNGVKSLVLATDPDREGEAISWHVQQELQRRGQLKGIQLARITFTEVTKAAVLAALQSPRAISTPLVEAYLARRALDYLVGFHLSPLLWRKLPGARSAGRVQSVALRLISERDAAIEAFKPEEYWTINATLSTPGSGTFQAAVTEVDKKKVSKSPITSEADATGLVERLKNSKLMVASTSDRVVSRNPLPPFITSTLQQDAASKLGFSPSQTMSVAQKLYEGTDSPEGEGFITYMRTDGVQIGQEALDVVRTTAETLFGTAHVADTPRVYRSKAKNAQEAHEAIRPTQPQLAPKDLPAAMPKPNKLLYELIWRRTLASQMASAKIKQVGADISDSAGSIVLRATSSELQFSGFQAAYATSFFRSSSSAPGDGEEDEEALKPEAVLSLLKEGDAVSLSEVVPEQHFTKPPPHFSEASLVKALEELGIGRPSTYASILRLLQERGYVAKEGKALHVESLGRVLSAFLEKYFQKYVDFGFTSSIEDLLDSVSAGKTPWKNVLRDFWAPFQQQIEDAGQISVREVIDELDALLGPHLFQLQEGQSQSEARKCPSCGSRLTLKLSRGGGFIGCGAYPDCTYQRPLSAPKADGSQSGEENGLAGEGRLLGSHPDSGKEIRLKLGRYGAYVEVAANKEDGKLRRAAVPSQLVADFSLQSALELLEWPKVLGRHPETDEEVLVAVGNFGPYAKCGLVNASLPKDMDAAEVSLEEAVRLVEKKKLSPRFQAKAAKMSQKKAHSKSSRQDTKQVSEAPKRERKLSGYQAFGKRRRQELKESGAVLSPPEIMKKIAEDWRSLTEPEKNEWKKSVEGNVSNEERGSDSEPKERTRKRQTSPYLVFCSKRRSELKEAGANMKQTEIMSLLGKEWRSFSDEDKEKFREPDSKSAA